MVGLPAVEDRAKLGHLEHRRFRHPTRIRIAPDGRALGNDGCVRVLETGDASEHFRQVERLHANPRVFEQLLAEPDGGEVGRPRADHANARVAHAADNAADGGELLEIRRERFVAWINSVQCGQRVLDVVLAEVVAGAHLAAEAVAA